MAVDWSLPKEKYKELNTKMDEGDQNIEKEEDASKNEEPEGKISDCIQIYVINLGLGSCLIKFQQPRILVPLLSGCDSRGRWY